MAKPKGRTMKIISTSPSLTPEARSFLEMLEFRVNRSDRGASVLSIGAGGDDREFAPVHLWPDEITNERHLRHYGIMDRLYRDFYGEPNMPRPQKARGFLDRDLYEYFTEKMGRQATEEESDAIRDHIVDQANRSPVVNAWAEGIDFVALHAIPFNGACFENGGHSQYNWLARSAPDAQAMKRFIVEHPMLAGVATSGSELFKVAKKAASPEAAYEALVAFVVEKGFPCTNAVFAKTTPPIPRTVLDRLKGVPSEPFVMGEEAISDMAFFLTLAVKLPPESLPRTPSGIGRMAAASRVIGCLAEDLSAEEAATVGYGFGIRFTDEEIRAVLRGVDFETVDLKKLSDGAYGPASLGQYGAMLAGREDWVRDYLQGGGEPADLEIDFSALKEALIRDGYVVVAMKAHEAVAGVEAAQAPAP
jgi:hypothetical protein